MVAHQVTQPLEALAQISGPGSQINPRVPAFVGTVRNAEEIQELIPSMGLNVIINILTPMLVGIGLLVR